MPAQSPAAPAGARVAAACRNAWLAGLGAASLTRDWLDNGAAPMLRTLVEEGALLEAKAMRVVEARVESSYARAGSALRRARRDAGAAIAVARTRVPRALARLPLPSRVAALVAPALDAVAQPRPRKAPARTESKAARVAPKKVARVAQKPRGKRAAAAGRARTRA